MISAGLKWLIDLVEKMSPPDWMPERFRRLGAEAARLLVQQRNARTLKRLIAGRLGTLDDIAEFLSARASPMRTPLVLISQIQRSGGSLLSQLLDGHPALAAYPGELRFGHTVSDKWPCLDPARGVDANFAALFDLKFGRQMRKGYIKGGDKIVSQDRNELVDRNTARHRFIVIPRVQYLVFKRLFERTQPNGARDILDLFFGAFFSAWLDYQGTLEGKKWLTAFAPRIADDEATVAAFFDCYPDGRLIQIVRDPKHWYPSAKRQRKAWRDGVGDEQLLDGWCACAESILRNKSRYGGRVIVLRFEDLVGQTKPTMQRLACELAIPFEPILLTPTFNTQPIGANSAFALEKPGVIESPLARADLLSISERRLIEAKCEPVYERVLADGAGGRTTSAR